MQCKVYYSNYAKYALLIGGEHYANITYQQLTNQTSNYIILRVPYYGLANAILK